MTGWEEFGIAGLVIGALFYTLFRLVQHQKDERTETRDLHREERKEWKEEANQREENLGTILSDLETTIQDLGSR